MSAGERLPLAQARVLADEVVALLAPACERVEIAGSIRRAKADAGDIEIVAIPHFYEAAEPAVMDLFDNSPTSIWRSALEARCARLGVERIFLARQNKDGKIAVGSKLKWLIYKNFALDVYICEREQWGVTMAIRTGPADFSHRLVTPRRQGGLCPSHLEFKGWRVRSRQSGEPLETPEESDVFAALGLDYSPPELRDRAPALAR